jgi:perosamine synthetase
MTTMLHCGEMGRGPADLLADWMSSWGEPEFPQATGRCVIFTQSGRDAILLAARIWGVGKKDEVLVPAYNCGSEISPLISTGARISMYRVDSGARIDLADLLSRITPRTRLVHITHYFGRPAELDGLARFCRDRKIKLLEDCALSLFSRPTGRIGDAAIFSFRKSLPACAGGALVLRDASDVANAVTKKSTVVVTAKGMLSLIGKWSQAPLWFRLAFRCVSSSECLAKEPLSSLPDLPASYYCPPNAVVHGVPRITLGLLKRTHAHEVVRRRRENYRYLRNCLVGIRTATFLWEEEMLPDGVCPLGLPMLVDDKWQWCKRLSAAGVRVTPWWVGCHRGLDWQEFPEALALKARLILLPVHQGLTTSHMEYTASVVRSLADLS